MFQRIHDIIGDHMRITLDVEKAYNLGCLDTTAGLFRGETALILSQNEFGWSCVTLPNSLNPKKEYWVTDDCLIYSEK